MASLLVLPGTTGNYGSAPDTAALSIVSNIDVRAYVAADDWTPAVIMSVVSKFLITGNQRSYLFQIDTTGKLVFIVSQTGTAVTFTAISSAATGFTDGSGHWIRAAWNNTSDIVQFFTSNDAPSVTSPTWTKLGTDIAASATGIFNSTALLELGSRDTGSSTAPYIGKMYRAQIRNNVLDDGTGIQFDARFDNVTVTAIRTPSSITEGSTNAATVTLNGAAWSWNSDTPTPSNIDGTGTVQTPTVSTATSATATPATVGGTGTIQAPTIVAKALPATVSGTGTVSTPVGVEAALPATIAGTGTVFAPVGVIVARPTNIAGTGTVFAPVVVLAALPATIAGTGTVFTPILAAVLATVSGTGTVFTPVVVLAAQPTNIAGIGTVFTVIGVERELAATVAGTGSMFAPVIVLAALPATIAGVGSIFTPALAGVVVTIAGTGTVIAPVVALVALPATIAGTGTVFSVSILSGSGTTVSAATILGTGSIFAPLVLEIDKPATIAGTGTVFTPVVVLVVLPATVNGTGVVQSPSIVTGAGTVVTATTINGVGTIAAVLIVVASSPSTLNGIGTVLTPIGVLRAVAATLAGVGTVFDATGVQGQAVTTVTIVGTGTFGVVTIAIAAKPSCILATGLIMSTPGATGFVITINAVGDIGIITFNPTGFVQGIGTINLPSWLTVAQPQAIGGVGTVYPMLAFFGVFVAIVLAIRINKRQATIGAFDRRMVLAVAEQGQANTVFERTVVTDVTERNVAMTATEGLGVST